MTETAATSGEQFSSNPAWVVAGHPASGRDGDWTEIDVRELRSGGGILR